MKKLKKKRVYDKTQNEISGVVMSDDCRAAFEAWASSKVFGFGDCLSRMPSGDYVDIRARAAWEAWQARPMKRESIEGVWACNHCENVEIHQREVTCWKCGQGEMHYRKINDFKKRGVSTC